MYNMSVCLSLMWVMWPAIVISLRDFPSAKLPFFTSWPSCHLFSALYFQLYFIHFIQHDFVSLWFFKVVYMLMCSNTFSEICFAWISFDFLFFCFIFLYVQCMFIMLINIVTPYIHVISMWHTSNTRTCNYVMYFYCNQLYFLSLK